MNYKVLNFKNLGLDMDKFKYTYSKNARVNVLEQLVRREKSILTPNQVQEKWEKGQVLCLSRKNTNKFYVFHDRSGRCPESSFQFFDNEGKFLFSYPWNGEIGRYKMLDCQFDGLGKKIDQIRICCTESRILVQDVSKVGHYNDPKEEIEVTTKVFDKNGNVERVYKPYSFKNYKNHDSKVLKDGKVCSLFDGAILDGDEFIDFCQHESLKDERKL